MNCFTRTFGILRSSARLILVAIGLLICVSTASTATADEYVSRHKLQALLRQGDFDTLEQTLAGLEQAYEAGRISDDVVDHAYYAFSSADPDFEDQFAEWIAAKPQSHRPFLGRGVYYRNLGWDYRGDRLFHKTPRQSIDLMVSHFRLAEQDLMAALALKPNSGVAYGYLIEMKIAAGSRNQRDALLRAGLRADPNSLAIRRYYSFGLTPWWGGGSALVNDPKYPVELPDRLRRFAENIERDAARTPGLRPLLGYLDNTVGEILHREGRYQEAAEYHDRAIVISDHWQFHGDAGENYFRMQRYDDAIASYSRALELRPDAQGFLRSRARAYWAKGQFDKVLEDMEAALALDPRDPEYLLFMGQALQHVGRHQDALEAVDAALLYGKYDDSVWFFRGSLYLYRFSDPQRALPDLKRARELAPDKTLYLFHYLYARIRAWT